MAARLVGEGAALGDGGDVGTVEGEDAVEDVAGFGDVVALGDDTEQVLVAAAGGGDVEAAASRRRRGQRDAVVDGVGLVAVFGGGVAQSDVFVDVVGGSVTVPCPRSRLTVNEPSLCDGGDGPRLPVAHRFTCRGDQRAVVAAGGHDVTDVNVFTAGDRRGVTAVEVSCGESGCLHGTVDGVDVVVRRGDEGDRFASLAVLDPGRGHPLRGGRRCCRG